MTPNPANRPVAQPGTTAFKVIAYLTERGAGAELSSSALANALGQSITGFGRLLEGAHKKGLLRRRFIGAVAMWSLGPNTLELVPKPAPRQLRGEDVRQFTVPALALPSVFAYGEDRQAAPFSVALSSDGRLICERKGRTVMEFTAAEAALVRKVASKGVRP